MFLTFPQLKHAQPSVMIIIYLKFGTLPEKTVQLMGWNGLEPRLGPSHIFDLYLVQSCLQFLPKVLMYGYPNEMGKTLSFDYLFILIVQILSGCAPF